MVPATCTADGYTIHDCDNCDYSYTNAYVDALGHAYKSTTWAFATDYSSATLTFVCENDDEHVMVLNATVTETVVNGTCSNFVKTTYTATVSYGGVNYTEEKVVESGSPDHDFSSDWKKDEGKHWHECVCGEKTDIGEHKFENAVITKNATCNEAGESTAYCVCGETKVTVIPATGEHNYVDGICTECGAEFVDTYYLNLINSWKNIDGFAIKIQNFTYEIKEKESNLLESLTLIGSIKQIDVAELALYIEDGKLCGAAIGSVTIYNGPIANAEAIYIFKAVIQDGYVYISLDNGQNVADKNTSIKMSVDALIEAMIENYGIDSESLYALDFFKETIIPVIDTLVEMHSEDVNTIFENVFNILFTFEKQADGSYIAALDYDKLHTLNENLATKSVAEVVDIYFGEGTFDGIVEFILEILDLEISEIPDYLDENGIDSAAIIEKLNELAAQTGAPDGYDVSDFINGEELEGVTVGMLMFGVQDDSYLEIFNEAIDYLREKSLYEMINANMVDEIKEGISNIIDMISGSVSVTFTTDRLGMITSIDIDVDEFTYTMDDEEIYVSFNLDIIY